MRLTCRIWVPTGCGPNSAVGALEDLVGRLEVRTPIMLPHLKGAARDKLRPCVAHSCLNRTTAECGGVLKIYRHPYRDQVDKPDSCDSILRDSDCKASSSCSTQHLHVKSEQHHIPLCHNVVLALASHLAALLGRLLAPRRHQIIIRKRLRTNKSSLKLSQQQRTNK
jgi:hypothetical protein